jgi:hypothetical protein
MSQAYQQLEREATSRARGQRAQTPGIYVRDSVSRATPERVVADSLEADPDIYKDYRDRHNAQAILHTLQRAGVRIG